MTHFCFCVCEWMNFSLVHKHTKGNYQNQFWGSSFHRVQGCYACRWLLKGPGYLQQMCNGPQEIHCYKLWCMMSNFNFRIRLGVFCTRVQLFQWNLIFQNGIKFSSGSILLPVRKTMLTEKEKWSWNCNISVPNKPLLSLILTVEQELIKVCKLRTLSVENQ